MWQAAAAVAGRVMSAPTARRRVKLISESEPEPDPTMKPPYPLLALFAFLLLPLVATVESLELSFLPHLSVGMVLFIYIFGGVICTWLFDYSGHHPAPVQREKHGMWWRLTHR